MHYIYYIYLKYIFMCVYIYLVFTNQFWCVKDLFTVGLESMYCLSMDCATNQPMEKHPRQ